MIKYIMSRRFTFNVAPMHNNRPPRDGLTQQRSFVINKTEEDQNSLRSDPKLRSIEKTFEENLDVSPQNFRHYGPQSQYIPQTNRYQSIDKQRFEYEEPQPYKTSSNGEYFQAQFRDSSVLPLGSFQAQVSNRTIPSMNTSDGRDPSRRFESSNFLLRQESEQRSKSSSPSRRSYSGSYRGKLNRYIVSTQPTPEPITDSKSIPSIPMIDYFFSALISQSNAKHLPESFMIKNLPSTDINNSDKGRLLISDYEQQVQGGDLVSGFKAQPRGTVFDQTLDDTSSQQNQLVIQRPPLLKPLQAYPVVIPSRVSLPSYQRVSQENIPSQSSSPIDQDTKVLLEQEKSKSSKIEEDLKKTKEELRKLFYDRSSMILAYEEYIQKLQEDTKSVERLRELETKFCSQEKDLARFEELKKRASKLEKDLSDLEIVKESLNASISSLNSRLRLKEQEIEDYRRRDTEQFEYSKMIKQRLEEAYSEITNLRNQNEEQKQQATTSKDGINKKNVIEWIDILKRKEEEIMELKSQIKGATKKDKDSHKSSLDFIIEQRKGSETEDEQRRGSLKTDELLSMKPVPANYEFQTSHTINYSRNSMKSKDNNQIKSLHTDNNFNKDYMNNENENLAKRTSKEVLSREIAESQQNIRPDKIQRNQGALQRFHSFRTPPEETLYQLRKSEKENIGDCSDGQNSKFQILPTPRINTSAVTQKVPAHSTYPNRDTNYRSTSEDPARNANNFRLNTNYDKNVLKVTVNGETVWDARMSKSGNSNNYIENNLKDSAPLSQQSRSFHRNSKENHQTNGMTEYQLKQSRRSQNHSPHLNNYNKVSQQHRTEENFNEYANTPIKERNLAPPTTTYYKLMPPTPSNEFRADFNRTDRNYTPNSNLEYYN
jgi:hypothetical protein